MIRRAEERGDIKPGDTLIEATSGNTGIALAMAAAIRGYRMLLIMPEDLSVERAQTMKAFGAELILTPRSGGMEYARDLAEQMQRDEAYLPKIYDPTWIDEMIYVGQSDAEEMARRLAREEGLFAGISAAGALWVALQVARQVENATIVFVVCDRGDRYLSTGVFPA